MKDFLVALDDHTEIETHEASPRSLIRRVYRLVYLPNCTDVTGGNEKTQMLSWQQKVKKGGSVKQSELRKNLTLTYFGGSVLRKMNENIINLIIDTMPILALAALERISDKA